jgi:hypothetical protein
MRGRKKGRKSKATEQQKKEEGPRSKATTAGFRYATALSSFPLSPSYPSPSPSLK